MSQSDLARRMGRPVQTVNEIVKGVKAITPDTALQLEKVIPSVPAYLWTKFEDQYRLRVARQEAERQLEQEARLLDSANFDPKLYKAMAGRGWIKNATSDTEKVMQLLMFFGISSLNNLGDVKHYHPAFRLSRSWVQDSSDYALAAWLRKGELEARELEKQVVVHPFNIETLKAFLVTLREFTLEDPETFFFKAQKQLAACGVLFVVVQHLPKTYAHGATFWLTPIKVVVQVSDRMKWADIFWFSLFHELGHVLLHGKRQTLVTYDRRDAQRDPNYLKIETDADAFAGNMLIPYSDYKRFLNKEDFSAAAVRAFAKQIGIAPGIIVGRLHHEKIVPPNKLNTLRRQYEIV